MTRPGSRFHKLSPSLTTRSPLRCRMATTPPAPTTWCASSWAKSTPATIPARTGTPVRPSLSGTGASRASFCRTPSPRSTFMCSALPCRAEPPKWSGAAFIALGRIEDYSDGVIFRHEQTLAKPKADRLELLRATRAHFGQLFMLYSDPAGEIDGVLVPTGSPDLETKDEYGVSHQVWKISDPSGSESGAGQDAGQETGDRRRPPSLRNRPELSQRAAGCRGESRLGLRMRRPLLTTWS